jgi:hypothetical protein
VQRVADQDERGQRLSALRARVMAMVPMQELLDGEEERETRQDPEEGAYSVALAGDCGRDHVQHRAAEQGARCESDERPHEPLERAFAEQQCRRSDECQRAHGHPTRDDPEKRHARNMDYMSECSQFQQA